MNREHAFEPVMGRLKAALAVGSDGKLAERLGLSNSAYANLKKRGSIPYERVIDLAISQNVNIGWLFTGQRAAPETVSGPQEGAAVKPSPLEKLQGLGAGLSERQLAQLQGVAEDYRTLNRLSTEVEALKQRLKTSQEDKPNEEA